MKEIPIPEAAQADVMRNAIEAFHFVSQVSETDELISSEVETIFHEVHATCIGKYGEMSREIERIAIEQSRRWEKLLRRIHPSCPRLCEKAAKFLKISLHIRSEITSLLDDTVIKIAEHQDGKPSIEESYLFVTHPDQLQENGGDDINGNWLRTLQFLERNFLSDNSRDQSPLERHLGEAPVVIGYRVTDIPIEDQEKNGKTDIAFDYKGPEEYRAFFERLFAEFGPQLKQFEGKMTGSQTRANQEAFWKAILISAPFVAIGIALDFALAGVAVPQFVRKGIEVFLRSVLGLVDRITIVTKLKIAQMKGQNVEKSYKANRDALIIGAAGSIPLFFAEALGSDITSTRHAAFVTSANSADNTAAATLKLIRNYKENREEGIQKLEALKKAFSEDVAVQGDYMGTLVVLLIDFLIRFFMNRTNTGYMLSKATAIAGEGAALGPLDTLVTYIYMVITRIASERKWQKEHFNNDSFLKIHKEMTQLAEEMNSKPDKLQTN